MKNVLIVDDERTFLNSLSEGLGSYAAEFNVIPAVNGRWAAEVLKSTPVHLVVTDLKMPEMDGFELLAYMSKECPDVPVIVMTAFGGPKTDERLRSLSVNEYIEKPLDYKELATRIRKELSSNSAGHIHGITLPAFLQLIEMEKKTCTLDITSAEKTGHFYFMKGELVEAETGDAAGETAAYDILCWDKAEIEIDPVCRKRKRNISLPLNHLLMEAFRLKDEKERRSEEEPDDVLGADIIFDIVGQNEETPTAKEAVMAMESHLQALKEIKGFKAAGIMNFTGEMLAFDSSDPTIDLSLVGATFNDIFRSAHEASRKIGLDACKETVISTPKGVVIMRCSGTDAAVHFHLIGIMAHDGNQALMKMQIEKMVPAVMAELT